MVRVCLITLGILKEQGENDLGYLIDQPYFFIFVQFVI